MIWFGDVLMVLFERVLFPVTTTLSDRVGHFQAFEALWHCQFTERTSTTPSTAARGILDLCIKAL